MAERPLPAYTGDEAYIFITWAHEDADLVYPHIRWLQDQGFNVWWDEGISPGAAWRAELAQAIRGCSLLVYFVTPNSVVREHCTREVNFALDEHHRPILAVHLAETRLPDALALSLSDRQAIFHHALEPTDYERKLLSAVATYLDQPLPEIMIHAPAPKSSPRRRVWPMGVVGMLVGAAIAVIATSVITRPVQRPPEYVSRFTLDMPPGVVMDRVNVNPLAISRDGRHVVFRGRSSEGSKLYVRSLESFDAIPIVEGVSESAIYDVSPDGESVIFWDRHLIKRAKIGGGPTATIREVAKASLGLNWGQDGTIVFSEGQVDGSRLMSTDTSGRPIATLTKPAAEGEAHILPHLLDDGSAVLYTVVEVGSEAPKRIEVFSLSTGEVKSLAEGVSPQVSSSGHLLFGRDGAIWAARFDAERLELTGDPLVVLENVAFNTMFSPVFDVADDGSMVYQRAEDVSSELTLAWIDHAGRSLELDLGELVLYEPRVAPDGRRVAVRRGRRNSLWVLALDRNAFTRLSDELVLSVLWHPSGKKIAYTPWKNVGNLYWRNADGTGTEERLTTSPRSQWASDWSQDGMALLYTECDGVYGEACDIGQVLMAEERVAESVLATPANEQHPTLSPDGRWLAYESDQSGRFEIYVRPYPDVGAGRWQISISGGRQPVWSPEGDMLYYVAGPAMAREMLAVSVNTNDGFESGVPEYLFSFAQEGYSELRSHDLHPDGDRFVIATRDTVRRNDEQLVYVLNWLDEVKRLVPINH